MVLTQLFPIHILTGQPRGNLSPSQLDEETPVIASCLEGKNINQPQRKFGSWWKYMEEGGGRAPEGGGVSQCPSYTVGPALADRPNE